MTMIHIRKFTWNVLHNKILWYTLKKRKDELTYWHSIAGAEAGGKIDRGRPKSQDNTIFGLCFGWLTTSDDVINFGTLGTLGFSLIVLWFLISSKNQFFGLEGSWVCCFIATTPPVSTSIASNTIPNPPLPSSLIILNVCWLITITCASTKKN